MKQNQTLNGKEFLALIKKEKDSICHRILLIQGDITIDDEEVCLDSIRLENMTFLGMVHIRNFKKPDACIILQSCKFLGGLCIEQNNGQSVSIGGCELLWLDIWSSSFGTAFIGDNEIEKSLDISGLTLSMYLSLGKNSYVELELIHTNLLHTIVVPFVRTTDLIATQQFIAARIPVFVSTEIARTMLKDDLRDVARTPSFA